MKPGSLPILAFNFSERGGITVRSPVKEVREKKGWSRRAFRELLMTTPIVVARMENGTMRIPDIIYESSGGWQSILLS